MSKYILMSEDKIGSIEYKGNKTEKEILAMVQMSEQESNWLTCERVPRDKHICKYCGYIAEGTYDELLCKECREIFGHSLFSEL